MHKEWYDIDMIDMLLCMLGVSTIGVFIYIVLS
jgi:hypothetical protein